MHSQGQKLVTSGVSDGPHATAQDSTRPFLALSSLQMMNILDAITRETYYASLPSRGTMPRQVVRSRTTQKSDTPVHYAVSAFGLSGICGSLPDVAPTTQNSDHPRYYALGVYF